MSLFDQKDPASALALYFEARKHKNSGYSLRAFGRDIGLDSPRLTMILARKQGLSSQKARAIASALDMNTDEMSFFVCLCEAHFSRSQSARSQAIERLIELRKYGSWEGLDPQTFSQINSPYHFIVRELVGLETFVYNPYQLSAALGISEIELLKIWSNLVKLKLLEQDESTGRWRSAGNVSKKYTGPSMDVVKYHQTTLRMAYAALDTVPAAERDFSTLTLPFHVSNMDAAREFVRKFRRSFEAQLTATGVTNNQICTLAIQLFPVTSPLQNHSK